VSAAQHTPTTYEALRAQMPEGKWSWLLDQIFERAQTAAQCREWHNAYKAEREAIERAAFKDRVARGGMQHVGNSGRV
jgi:hypothetical protein